MTKIRNLAFVFLFVSAVVAGQTRPAMAAMDPLDDFASFYGCLIDGVGEPYSYGWTAYCTQNCAAPEDFWFHFDALDTCIWTCGSYENIVDEGSADCLAGCGCGPIISD